MFNGIKEDDFYRYQDNLDPDQQGSQTLGTAVLNTRRDMMIALYGKVTWDEKIMRLIEWLLAPYERWQVKRRTARLFDRIKERHD